MKRRVAEPETEVSEEETSLFEDESEDASVSEETVAEVPNLLVDEPDDAEEAAPVEAESRPTEQLGAYFAGMAKAGPLLSADQERELGLRILQHLEKCGQAMNRLLARPGCLKPTAKPRPGTACGKCEWCRLERLSPNPDELKGKKLKALVKELLRDERACAFLSACGPAGSVDDFDLMVKSNLRLVIPIAKKWRRQGRISFADLIQEGNVGLMKAVVRFDARKGWRFSTYATWWIRHAIGRAISDTSTTVRIPVHARELATKVLRLRHRLENKFGHELDDVDLAPHAAKIILTTAHTRALERGKESSAPTKAEIAEFADEIIEKMSVVNPHFKTLASLNAPVGHEEGHAMQDLLASDDGPPAPVDGMIGDERTAAMEKFLQRLKPVERDVLTKRFGIGSRREEQTLAEVGEEYGLSRERIRQIQERALAKMREAMTEAGFEA